MHQHNHENLMKGIVDQLKQILATSEQAVYIYLDDHSKACNKNFASMLGYPSPHAWANEPGAFTDLFVDGKSRNALVSAYRSAMGNLIGSAVNITWKKKDGKLVKSNVILVPMSFEGHLYALHFISKA